MLNPSVRDGIMARLVSVERALELRPYPVDAEVTFRLVDEVCPWNAGEWRLSTAAEGGAMRRADGERMDATLGPDTLAQVAWGFLRPSVAWRAGLLDVENPRVLERWDNAFRTAYPPHEAEHTW
jgi:predicted acetyltransferase